MPRFRRKVFEVETMQYTGETAHPASVPADFAEFLDLYARPDGPLPTWRFDGTGQLWIYVTKHSAWEHLPIDGWAIGETDGVGVYPCTAEEFEARYEPVEAEVTDA